MNLTRDIEAYGLYMTGLGYSPVTIEGYQYCLKGFLGYAENEGGELSREMVYKYQTSLSQREPAMSLDMQYVSLKVLKGFMRYLAKTGKIINNPAAELELPRCRKKLPQGVMNAKEIKRLLEQPDTSTVLGVRDRAILELMYSSGLRNKEVRGLRVSDVDLKEGWVRIVEGKGGKERMVPMGKEAGAWVGEYLRQRGEEREESTLFLGRRKTKLMNDGLTGMVKRYVKEAGIKKRVTPHSLRHTCATHLLKKRANLRYVQALLGHKSIETTQRYTQVEISDLKREHQRYHPRG